jgi:hypothetical protein
MTSYFKNSHPSRRRNYKRKPSSFKDFYLPIPCEGDDHSRGCPVHVRIEGQSENDIKRMEKKLGKLVEHAYYNTESQGVIKDTNGNDAIKWICRDEDDESYRVSITFICVGSTEYLPDKF